MSRGTTAVVVMAVGSMLGLGVPEFAGHAAGKGDPKKGKVHYQQYCARCHGERGLGNGPMAKATTPPATKLSGRVVREKSNAQLFDAIANGMGAAMPAWRGVLNEQQLLDVVAYVRSLSG